MPPGFRDQGKTSVERNTELWLSGGFAAVPFPLSLRNSRFGTAFARLKLGLPLASAHIDALVASLKKQYPADYPPQAAWTIHLIPLAETLVGNVLQSLILLFGAVGMVLLFSCVNVANLLLARAKCAWPLLRPTRERHACRGVATPQFMSRLDRVRWHHSLHLKAQLAAQISLCGFDGNVTEEELNLFEFTSTCWQRWAHVLRRS